MHWPKHLIGGTWSSKCVQWRRKIAIILFPGTPISVCWNARRSTSKCWISAFPHTSLTNSYGRHSSRWPFANVVVGSYLLVSTVINATIDFIRGAPIRCHLFVVNYIWTLTTNCCSQIPTVRRASLTLVLAYFRAGESNYLLLNHSKALNQLLLDILGLSTPKIDPIRLRMCASTMYYDLQQPRITKSFRASSHFRYLPLIDFRDVFIQCKTEVDTIVSDSIKSGALPFNPSLAHEYVEACQTTTSPFSRWE